MYYCSVVISIIGFEYKKSRTVWSLHTNLIHEASLVEKIGFLR